MLLLAMSVIAIASDWGYYGGDPGGTRFSRIDSVTSSNVIRLQKIWEYHTGALQPATALNHKAAFECTPVLVNGTLYVTTPFNRIIALDPATGAEKWKYDPHVNREHDYSEVTSRGVAAWTDSHSREGSKCRTRPFAGP